MDQVHELAVCRRELRRLEAENAALRDSSESFANLAERLNVALKAERRAHVPARSNPSEGSPPSDAHT